MKVVIILMVVMAYVFHEVISNHNGEYNSQYSGGSQYGGGSSYHDNVNDESYAGDDSYGGGDEFYDQDQTQNDNNNNICPFTCEAAQSVWFQQSQAVPLGYYVNSGQSDHKLIPGFNYQTVNSYKFELVMGNAFQKPDSNLAPIFEFFCTDCFTTYYSTISDNTDLVIPDKNKFKLKGIAFYCYPVPFFYTIPVFEFFCQSGSGSNKVTDIIVTTDFDSVTTPGTGGCLFTEILCYILPPKQTGGSYGNGAYQTGGMQSGGRYSNNYGSQSGY